MPATGAYMQAASCEFARLALPKRPVAPTHPPTHPPTCGCMPTEVVLANTSPLTAPLARSARLQAVAGGSSCSRQRVAAAGGKRQGSGPLMACCDSAAELPR
jgi:hypothetical protein